MSGEIIPSVDYSTVPVFDCHGRRIIVDMLKKYDLLLVYWKKPIPGSINIHNGEYASLMEFHAIDKDYLIGFCHDNFDSCSSPIRYGMCVIREIHMSGSNRSVRVMRFIKTLFDLKHKEEIASQKMRDNIDRLKA